MFFKTYGELQFPDEFERAKKDKSPENQGAFSNEFYITVSKLENHIKNKLNLKSLKKQEREMLKLLYTVGQNKSFEHLEDQFEQAAAGNNYNRINDSDLIAFATNANVLGLKDMIKTI